MHSYATDSDRRTIPAKIGALTVMICLGCALLFKSVKIEIPWFLESPSFLFVFGVLFTSYDRYFWKLNVPFLKSGISDISGTWAGYAHSTVDDKLHSCILIVTQTWTEINIRGETTNFCSHSRMAVLNISASERDGLSYEFFTDPRRHDSRTTHSFPGTMHLRIDPLIKEMNGKYYTGRQPQTVGTMTLTRVTKRVCDYQKMLEKLEAGKNNFSKKVIV